ncbi:MAG: glycosyltransferase [Ktedonobacterales bacterium]|nr:glycosyltransferase [Ktedonobacterales bacterium]
MRAAMTLAQAGYDVTLIDVEHDASLPAREERDGIHFHHILLPRWLARFYDPTHALPWLLFKGVRMVQGVRRVVGTSADAYHASDLAALPACYLAARLRRKPVIYEAYELPMVQPHFVRRRLLHRLTTRLLRTMVPRCAGVIVVSPPIATEMRARFGGPQPIVLRNIPPYQPPVTSNRLREHLGLAPETRIALYQGGLQDNRGLDVLVHAGKYLAPDAVIVMLGDGESKPRLEALIAREGVGERVKMVPAAPYAELLSWTASADLGLSVLPPDYSLSIRLCLPNKLFEYLMAGLPVLASQLEAIAEILRTYDVGQVVPSLEPAAIGQAINAMLADTEGLSRMRRNALAAARHDLCWEVEQRRLLHLYAGLPGMPQRSPQPVRLGPILGA